SGASSAAHAPTAAANPAAAIHLTTLVPPTTSPLLVGVVVRGDARLVEDRRVDGNVGDGPDEPVLALAVEVRADDERASAGRDRAGARHLRSRRDGVHVKERVRAVVGVDEVVPLTVGDGAALLDAVGALGVARLAERVPNGRLVETIELERVAVAACVRDQVP